MLPRGNVLPVKPGDESGSAKEDSKSSRHQPKEQSKKKSKSKDKLFNDYEDVDEDEDPLQAVAKRSRKRKTCRLLSVKAAKPGVLVLGVVSHVGSSLMVDLADGCHGRVVEGDGSSDDDSLASMWSVGDFVIGSVMEEGKLNLSLAPERVCQWREGSELKQGDMCYGVISSIEDKGWHVQGPLLPQGAFLAKDQVPEAMHSKLLVGRPVFGNLMHVRGRVFSMSLLHPGSLQENSLSGLLPGMTVRKLVAADSSHPSDGWRLSFGPRGGDRNAIVGDAHWAHLPQLSAAPIPFAPQDQARVIWVDQERGTCGLSFRPWLMEMTPCTPSNQVPVRGDKAVVVRVSGSSGVWVMIGRDQVGFASSKMCLDKEGDSLDINFIPGSKVPYRLLSDHVNRLDGSLRVALSDSLLRAYWVRKSDLSIATPVTLVVDRVMESGGCSGVIDGTASRLRGFLSKFHVSESKVKVGARLRCRVWSVDPGEGDVVLTAKRRFLDSDVQFLTPSTCAVGAWALGVVVRVEPRHALVTFPGGLIALLPINACSVSFIEDVSKVVSLGDVVRARITRITDDFDIFCSLLAEDNAPKDLVPQGLPPVGSSVRGTVTKVIVGQGFEMSLSDGSRGYLSMGHLSDWPRLALYKASNIQAGKTFDRLLVFGHSPKYHCLLTVKPSYLMNASTLPRSPEGFKVGQRIMAGVFSRKLEHGFLFNIWHDLSVLCPAHALVEGRSVQPDAMNSHLDGHSVFFQITSINAKAQALVRASFSGQPEDMGVVLHEYLALMASRTPKDMFPGSIIKAQVLSVGASGASLRIRGGDLMEYEASCSPLFASSMASWRKDKDATVVIVDMDPCAVPLRFDVVPVEVIRQHTKTAGYVLHDNGTLTVMCSGKPSGLAFGISVPEWSQKLLESPDSSAFPVGTVATFTESSMESPLSGAIMVSLQHPRLKASNVSSFELGQVYEMTVSKVLPHVVMLSRPSGERGCLHISELADDADSSVKLSTESFTVGQPVRVIYIGQQKKSSKAKGGLDQKDSNKKHVSLSHHFSLRLQKHLPGASMPEKSDGEDGSWLGTVPVAKDAKVGDVFHAVVTNTNATGFVLAASPALSGSMFVLDYSEDDDIINDFATHVPIGTRVQVSVVSTNPENHFIDFASINSTRKSSPGDGDVLKCYVKAKHSDHAVVMFGHRCVVQLSGSDVDDFMHENPMSLLPEVGGFLYAALKRLPDSENLIATTRPSVTGIKWDFDEDGPHIQHPALAWGAKPVVGDIVHGVVQGFRDALFVDVGQELVARSPAHLCFDRRINAEEYPSMFPVGKVVKARVIKVAADPAVPRGLRLKVTLKKRLTSSSKLLNWDNIAVGDVFDGDVFKVEKYGLIIRCKSATRSAFGPLGGLAHASKIFDGEERQDHTKVYQLKDYVIAKVISVIREEGKRPKISLTMRPSDFTEEDLKPFQEVDDDEEQDQDEQEEQEEEKQNDQQEQQQSQEKTVVPVVVASSKATPKPASLPSAKPVLPAVGFFQDDQDENSDEDSSDEDQEDAKASRTTSKRPRDEDELKRLEEREEALAKRTARPETDEDFERLLMGKPHSSELWVRWMSFKLASNDIEGARSVINKALSRVDVTMKKERINLWNAFINLEAKFGKKGTLDAVVTRGAKEIGRFEMDSRVLDAYERDATTPASVIEEHCVSMLKRFGSMPDAWLRVGQHYIRAGDGAKASDLLQRALRTVENSDERIQMTSRWAQTEFKEGSVERGRTIFFGLLDNYPKRTDLLIIFLDMEETRAKDWDAARQLYRRATSLNLSSKKMKYFLRRWMVFEKAHGDEKDQEEVASVAKGYIEKKANAAGNDSDE